MARTLSHSRNDGATLGIVGTHRRRAPDTLPNIRAVLSGIDWIVIADNCHLGEQARHHQQRQNERDRNDSTQYEIGAKRIHDTHLGFANGADPDRFKRGESYRSVGILREDSYSEGRKTSLRIPLQS
jgi:hypothetical protein